MKFHEAVLVFVACYLLIVVFVPIERLIGAHNRAAVVKHAVETVLSAALGLMLGYLL